MGSETHGDIELRSIGTTGPPAAANHIHCEGLPYGKRPLVSKQVMEERREIWQHEFNHWYEIRKQRLRCMT